jgi:putative phosphoribosyl transferase
MLFHDRRDAGRRLAAKLSKYANRPDVVVLALPRGGVPVGYEVARALNVPLDIFLVRKLGFPDQEELAMGAIASGGVRIFNRGLLSRMHVPEDMIQATVAREERELQRRERLYRGDRPPLNLKGKTVILVDDGLATGASMRAAAAALRQQEPARIVVAVPVAARETCDEFRDLIDEIVCGETPEPFLAVGYWYEQFDQTDDDEVRSLLERARTPAKRSESRIDTAAGAAGGRIGPDL